MNNFVIKGIMGGASLFILMMSSHGVMAQSEADHRVKQLENKLQEIQNELIKMKTESAQTTRKVDQIQETSTQTTRKVEQIQETTQKVEQTQKARMDGDGSAFSESGEKRTMLFFRGGFARSDEHRNGVSMESRVVP